MSQTVRRVLIYHSHRVLTILAAPALPRSASWGQKGGTPVLASASVAPLGTATTNGRSSRVASTRGGRNVSSSTPAPSRPSNDPSAAVTTARSRAGDRKPPSATSSATTSSRPSTPASSLPPRPSAAVEAAAAVIQVPVPPTPAKSSKTDRPSSPTHSRKQKSVEKATTPTREVKASPRKKSPPVPTEDEHSSPLSPVPASVRIQDIRQESLPPLSPASTATDSLPSNNTPPPPPGLGFPANNMGTGAPTYQLSNQARALMDDVLNRRSSTTIEAINVSPFPDFDRTLSNLGDGSFSFSLTSDPKVARGLQTEGISIMSTSPTTNGFFDPFSMGSAGPSPINQHFSGAPQATGFPPRRPPSSSGFANSPLSSVLELDSRMSRTSGSSLSYAGSFNPFSEGGDRTGTPSPAATAEDDPLRRGSKFGFARKDSAGFSAFGGSATNSPMRYNDNLPLPVTPMFSSADATALKQQTQQLPPPSQGSSWGYNGRELSHVPAAPPGLIPPHEKPSPRLQYQSPQAAFASANGLQQPNFSPFSQGQGMSSPAGVNDLSINLRDLLNMSDRHSDASLLNHSEYY